MDRACSTYKSVQMIIKVLQGKPEGKRPLGRHRDRKDDNIITDLKEIGRKVVD
jgi:hypothetical protein